MSRLRVSHMPGGWLDEGPSSVRQSTHIGGQAVVGTSTPGAKNDPWLFRDKQPSRKVKAARCGERMARNDICDRIAEHAGYHASRATMDKSNAYKRRAA